MVMAILENVEEEIGVMKNLLQLNSTKTTSSHLFSR